ncbi:MAG TPA: MFS transporter [Burkholderiales bacterium]|jgi:ATP-dependent HslUV protease subunit HslV|nr:MFS transporter [Burkholderiales bacterium]
MTTIAVVKKNGYTAIAADTLTKWGTGKESAAYIANNNKIVAAGDTFIGASGSATFKTIMHDYFARAKTKARFGSTLEIFRTWQAFHEVLKNEYFLVTTSDKDDSLESSRFDVLLANPHGIFGVGAHRTVQEYVKFYAIGSGTDVALGAMYGVYDDPKRSAEDVARFAIEAAAEFDDATGLPVMSHSIKLKRR